MITENEKPRQITATAVGEMADGSIVYHETDEAGEEINNIDLLMMYHKIDGRRVQVFLYL